METSTSTSTSYRGRRGMMNDAGDGNGGGEISGPSKSNLQEFEFEEKEILTEKELKEKEKWGKDMREMEKEMEMEKEKNLLVKQTEMFEKEKEMLFKMMIKEKKKGTWKNMWKKLKEKGTGKKMKKKGIWEDLEMWWMKELWKKEKEQMLVKDKREKEKEKEMRKKMKEKEPESLPDWEMGTAKCLCLLGRGPEGKKGPVLYLFNLLDERASTIGEDKEDEDGKQRRRWPGMQVITPAESIRRPEYFNTSVVVGSVLFVLGGMLENPENEQEDPENEQDWSFHNQVFLFDTNHPREGWIKGPDMLNDRCSCKAVAVESKIYVFGGNNKTTRPWAEFLDPEKNKWEPLPALPDDSLMHDLLYNPVVYGGPGEGKKIILSCRRYIYHVDAQTWEEFRPPEEMRNFSSNLTSVGNILYWTTFGNLFSFDMKTRDVDFGLVQGYKLSKYEEQFLTEPTLLHLEGDYFCFITLKDLPEGRTQVRCSKFQVSRQGWFKASVVCCNTCIIDCPVDIDWSNAFVLNGKLGAEKSEGSSIF